MSPRQDTSKTGFAIPRDLDAGTAPGVHEALLKRLSGDGAAVRVEFEGDGPIWPLALQLAASAARSAPAGRIAFGPAATAALQSLDTSKEVTR